MMSSKLEIPSYGDKHSAVLCKFSGFHSGAMQEFLGCHTSVLMAPSIPLKCWESINSNAALHCRILNLQFVLDTKVESS